MLRKLKKQSVKKIEKEDIIYLYQNQIGFIKEYDSGNNVLLEDKNSKQYGIVIYTSEFNFNKKMGLDQHFQQTIFSITKEMASEINKHCGGNS